MLKNILSNKYVKFSKSPFFGILLSFLLLNTCSQIRLQPTDAERSILEQAMTQLGPDYSNPRLVQGELILTISNTELFEEDSSAVLPSLQIWIADISDYSTQKLIGDKWIDPSPTKVFSDAEYGNQILYWDLSSKLMTGYSKSIARTFQYVTYDYRPIVDPVAEIENWSSIPNDILEKYTRPEQFLEQDTVLVNIVHTLIKNIENPVHQAKAIYTWVQDSMTYVYPPRERGVRCAIETLEGDCGQYSALFMTMARIAGIPARQQSGFNFYPGNTGAHVWSEIYLPIKGWVPVDATRDDGFLHLDNRRLITSMGLNIPLQHAPEWATFANSEVEDGKTDFMQMFTLVSRGVKADYQSERKILRSVELNW